MEFPRFPFPMVVFSPCPGYTIVCSGSFVNFSKDPIMSLKEENGWSVLPTRPANRVSPEKTIPSLQQYSDILPSLCPGVWMTSNSKAPTFTRSPSCRIRSAGGEAMASSVKPHCIHFTIALPCYFMISRPISLPPQTGHGGILLGGLSVSKMIS